MYMQDINVSIAYKVIELETNAQSWRTEEINGGSSTLRKTMQSLEITFAQAC